MTEGKLVLWKHSLSKNFPPDGYSLMRNADGVKPGEMMQENLGKLVRFCQHDGREWSIAKIVCGKSDVEPVQGSGGWYTAVKENRSEEGFVPAYSAIREHNWLIEND